MQATADPKESGERNLLAAALFHPITHSEKRRNTAGKVACAPRFLQVFSRDLGIE
jgi:hypothetical protein